MRPWHAAFGGHVTAAQRHPSLQANAHYFDRDFPDKKVLKQMREQYDAHVVEVTGVLKSDLPQDDALHRTLGKTKVVFGVGTPTAQQNVANQPPAMPVLDVRSFDGTAAPCGK